jgi:hypothetical protein
VVVLIAIPRLAVFRAIRGGSWGRRQVEGVLAVAAARQAGELGGHLHHTVGELLGQLGGDAGVSQGETARACLRVGQIGLRTGVGDKGKVAVHGRVGEDDGVGGTAVEAFFDGPNASRTRDLQEPGVHEHVDVVGNRAAWFADPFCQLSDCHGPLENEVEDQ